MWANVLYFCLHKLRILPSTFLALPQAEQAFIMAAISHRAKTEAKLKQETERKAGTGKSRRR